MRKKILFLAGMMACCSLAGAQEISKTWVADKGNGTYQNPVLHADYSDPDVCAAGDDFYMTASSFNCIPRNSILHSNDLVNWSLVNYALPIQEPEEFFDKAQHGKGVWAPAIRFHNGEFYIYWGDPDYGIYMIKAKDPKGRWSKPVLVKAGKERREPDTTFGMKMEKVYLVHAYAGSRSGVNSIVVICELNAEGTEVISDPVMVFDGNDGKNHTVEGPKLYKRNGYYYIFCSGRWSSNRLAISTSLEEHLRPLRIEDRNDTRKDKYQRASSRWLGRYQHRRILVSFIFKIKELTDA